MTKKKILERLNNTIKIIKKLKDEEFDYSKYVTRSKGNCGTICCVVGWYPKYFPESGLYWLKGRLESENMSPYILLRKWHGLNSDTIEVLFYGYRNYFDLSNKGKKVKKSIYDIWKKSVSLYVQIDTLHVCALNGENSTKKEVQSIFEFIYYMINNGYIKNYK